MESAYYEQHNYEDPMFPIIFHHDSLQKNSNEVFTHWHINIELIYIESGTAEIVINSAKVLAEPKDIILINSNALHSIASLSDHCTYYCLIIDSEHCESLGFDTVNNLFLSKTRNPEIQNIFNLIVKEMANAKEYYKTATVALCTTMLILLFRHLYVPKGTGLVLPSNSKTELVKKGIEYLSINYTGTITIDALCSEIGISKYYYCRTFKQITGKTITEFVNILRTRRARYLISECDYTVTEAALETGFQDIAYFSKCFKKYFGYPPSTEKTHQSS